MVSGERETHKLTETKKNIWHMGRKAQCQIFFCFQTKSLANIPENLEKDNGVCYSIYVYLS